MVSEYYVTVGKAFYEFFLEGVFLLVLEMFVVEPE